MLHRTCATRIRRYLSSSGTARQQSRRRPISAIEILEDRALLSAVAALVPPEEIETGWITVSNVNGSATSSQDFVVQTVPLAFNDAYAVTRGGTLNVLNGNVSIADMQQINPIAVTGDTGEKPQSKVWQQGGSWWAVFSDSNSTNVWRLNGSTWTSVLELNNRSGVKADVKVVGNLVHVLLHSSAATELRTIQFVPGTGGAPGTYGFWSTQPNLVTLPSMANLETVTLDVDATGRMWVAYERANQVRVRHSSGPYTAWSAEISLATGLNSDDIASVIALPNGRIGVFWSNQTAQRFGFRTHVDGTDPTVWTANEVPASQAALNVGNGMADDHLNLAVKADGTLYVAVKTEYSNSGFPRLVLLVRRPNGVWQNPYEIDFDRTGTRPIVQLSSVDGGLIYSYRETDSSGPIRFRKLTDTGTNILVGPEQTLLSGSSLNNVSGSKANFANEVVFIAAGGGSLAGVRLPYRYGVLSNDRDATGDVLTTILVVGPTNGTLTLNPNGTFAYSHNGGTSTSDSFTYRATDGLGNSNIATVSIAINPPAGPEVTVLGNGTNIVDGDTTPSASDFTNFGSVSQGGAAVSRSFTVRNDGTAPLSLNALTVPAGFTITNNLVSSLAVGASDTITVRLDTATVGTKSGQISFTTNDADESTFNFSISGTVTSAGGTTTVTLQDGVNGYAGTADAHIRGDQSTKNYGTLTGLQMHGNPDKAALIRWNVSTIPTNAVVQSASITVNVTNETNQAFEIYGLLRSWVENQVSWTAAATGNNWATAGAQGASDRGSTVLGSITSPTNGLVTINLNAAGIALLQSWINNPAANNGIVIQDYATTNGLDISSSEIATVASRPKLTITYGTGSSLLAASTPDVLVTETSLTQRSLNTIADAVARRWLAAAPSESRAALRGALDSITFAIADLPDRAIGSSFGNMILIDRNAAGFGWFIDSSPRDDREFSALGIASHGTAEARIDLLTAVAHEVGHLIGLDHSDGGLMSNTLAAGQRKELPAVDATAIDRLFKSLGDANTPLLNFA